MERAGHNKISRNIKIPFKMIGGDRIDDTPVHKALREVLANCLINADFFIPRGIVIKQEIDSLFIENPGSIRVGKYQMKAGGESDPRNKALMKMFNLIGIGERSGSGVPQLLAVWKNEGWIEPIIEEKIDPERTILKMYFIKKVAIKSGDKKVAIKSGDKNIREKTQLKYDQILSFMEVNKWYKSSDFINVLDVKSSRIKQLLNALVQKELIIENGKNKSKRYKKNSN